MIEVIKFELHIADFIVAIITLFVFGLWYNRWVADLGKRGRDRGYMGFIVALGCTITVVVAFLWPTRNLFLTLVILVPFVASGTPMIWGSIVRNIEMRERRNLVDRRPVKSERRQVMLENVMARFLGICEELEPLGLLLMQLHEQPHARDFGDSLPAWLEMLRKNSGQK